MKIILVKVETTCVDSFDKDQKTIKTPGYPQEFKDTLCNWEIKPPKGTYVELNRFEYNFGSWKTSCRGRHHLEFGDIERTSYETPPIFDLNEFLT